MQGSVESFKGTFGFIRPDGKQDSVFVHFTGINGDGFRTLNAGDRVSFEVEQSDRGPVAYKVERIPPGSQAAIRRPR